MSALIREGLALVGVRDAAASAGGTSTGWSLCPTIQYEPWVTVRPTEGPSRASCLCRRQKRAPRRPALSGSPRQSPGPRFSLCQAICERGPWECGRVARWSPAFGSARPSGGHPGDWGQPPLAPSPLRPAPATRGRAWAEALSPHVRSRLVPAPARSQARQLRMGLRPVRPAHRHIPVAIPPPDRRCERRDRDQGLLAHGADYCSDRQCRISEPQIGPSGPQWFPQVPRISTSAPVATNPAGQSPL